MGSVFHVTKGSFGMQVVSSVLLVLEEDNMIRRNKFANVLIHIIGMMFSVFNVSYQNILTRKINNVNIVLHVWFLILGQAHVSSALKINQILMARNVLLVYCPSTGIEMFENVLHVQMEKFIIQLLASVNVKLINFGQDSPVLNAISQNILMIIQKNA